MFQADELEVLEPLLTDQGELRSAGDAGTWNRCGWSQVSADGRMLLYSGLRIGTKQAAPVVRSHRGLLESFCSLADAEPPQFARFMRSWGPLHICRPHGRPGHCGELLALPVGVDVRQYLPAAYRGPASLADTLVQVEPLGTWRTFAQLARALLRVSAAILDARTPAVADLDALDPHREILAVSARRESTALRVLVVHHLGTWTRDLRPELHWTGERPVLQFGATTLYGALGLQLVAACGQVKRSALCAGCGVEYLPPARAAKQGQRSFCPDCRKAGVPRRLAVADYRARQRPL
ncbi:MAG: hypothetical protein IPM24_03960 [Bryobacterales bacterium]|nr:hypothetical protein [Bryobacterales bacterium]